jgi:hypothetical protein
VAGSPWLLACPHQLRKKEEQKHSTIHR